MWKMLAISLGLILLAALLLHVGALHLHVGAGALNDPAIAQVPRMPIQPGQMLDGAMVFQG